MNDAAFLRAFLRAFASPIVKPDRTARQRTGQTKAVQARLQNKPTRAAMARGKEQT